MKLYYEKFRGDPETIRMRLQKYVRYFDGCHNIIDLGCGRGEFISLSRDKGLNATGVDSDPDMINLGRKAGLNIIHDDVLGFLRINRKFDGMMASHLIEHLDPKHAEEFLKLSYDSLEENGKLVIITPNIENLTVLTKGFWLDNTHVRAYPLELLIEMAMEAGFEITDFGEDIDTASHSPLGSIRMNIMKLLLKIVGMSSLYRGMYSALDIFVVGVKK